MTDIDTTRVAPSTRRNSQRVNMVGRCTETWRPPLFRPARTRTQRVTAAARRYVDLQAGSIWNDLKPELAPIRGTLVDIGCGAQPYRGLVGPGAKYIGLDTTDAADNFGYAIPDTTYFDGETWPIESACADAVLCTETLEHVAEPMTLLLEAARCLRPGGRLILTVPFAARWHYIPNDYWRYTPASLKLILDKAGFRDVTIYARGNALTVACYKIMALLLQPLFQPRRNAVSLAGQVLSLTFIPLILLLATIGNISLRATCGDDCLGYSVIAMRP